MAYRKRPLWKTPERLFYCSFSFYYPTDLSVFLLSYGKFLRAYFGAAGGPDLILLDIMLPDQSGIGFIDVIRAKNPKLPIIMISGLGDLPIVLNAMKAGAADYMQKPIGYEELWNKITKILPQDTVSSAM